MPRSANRSASSSKKGWSPRTSGRIRTPAPWLCSGLARYARNAAPSSPLRVIGPASMAAPLIGSIGGRLSWLVHMRRMLPRGGSIRVPAAAPNATTECENPAARLRGSMAGQLVVQKFGGSSLAEASRIRRVAQRIARARATGSDLVVVVSAMGDTTDELLALAGAITTEPDPRELDMLLATGEHQSATLVSMALHALGVKAISLTGAQAGITTDASHGRARIANVEPRRVRAELDRGNVVIVAGFQGQKADATAVGHAPGAGDATGRAEPGETTTLGRGGSDTTAVALAAALRADRCQIFTDVRGIYTADPRLVGDARQLAVIGYEEMLELAQQGAQVMQVRAVELGWINGVEIEVLSSFEDAPGTLIREDPLVEQRNKVRGLAHDRNVAKVTLLAVPDRPGVARSVFAPLADAGINVDMIVQNVGHDGATDLSFTVPRVELARAERVLDPRSEEHTSELQSPCKLVCRLLLEKKKTEKMQTCTTRDANTQSKLLGLFGTWRVVPFTHVHSSIC